MLKRSEHIKTVRLYTEEDKTLEEIGRLLGISRQAVQQRLIAAGIPRRSAHKFASLTEEVLKRLYVDQHKSTVEIARKVGCTSATVAKYLQRYGIEARPMREVFKPKIKNPDLTKERLEQLYVTEEKTTTEIARLTGYSPSRILVLLAKYEIQTRKKGRRKKLTSSTGSLE